MPRDTIATVSKKLDAMRTDIDQLREALTATIARADAAIERTALAASMAEAAAQRAETAGQLAHAAATGIVEVREEVKALGANLTALADRLPSGGLPEGFVPVGKVPVPPDKAAFVADLFGQARALLAVTPAEDRP